MSYPKPTQEEMNLPSYAGRGEPNYQEPQRVPGYFVSGDESQPYYIYHKNRWNEYR